MLKHVRETITSMLQALADIDLKHWLGLCKQVVLASSAEDDAQPSSGEGGKDVYDFIYPRVLNLLLVKSFRLLS